MLPGPDKILRFIARHDLVRTRELAARLSVADDEFDAFVTELRDLQDDGGIIRIPGQGWTLPERTVFRIGTLSMARKGHAYVGLARPERAGDFFIPPDSVGGAFHGDVVLVEPRAGRRSLEEGKLRVGRVVDVVRRREELVRGLFRMGDAQTGYVRPIERSPAAMDIAVAGGASGGARDGQKVLVRLLEGFQIGGRPRGEVVHVIEDDGSYDSDLRTIAMEHGLEIDIPASAAAEAEAFPAVPTSAELEGRLDLRAEPIFTVDPDDAKDFDDAVSIERLGDGGFRLGVHIADVSAYVRPGGALDAMARRRGTSVYLPGRVLPMLPERISNDLASLKPGVDRLTKSVFIDFDRDGAPRGRRLERSVIRSHRRFTYDEVLAILLDLEGKAPQDAGREALPLPSDHAGFAGPLRLMARLRDLLHRRRLARGCLELEVPRLRIRLDEEGAVAGVVVEKRDPAHHLIEELMLAANEAVASFFLEHDLPLLWRVHEPPEAEMLEAFFYFLEVIDERHGRKRRARDLQAVVESVRSEPYGALVHYQLLRSLFHAEYSAERATHFALATDTYCHFTSPIRRYPDLVVHQLLDEWFRGELRGAQRKAEWRSALPRHASASSHSEKMAERAERELTRLRVIRHLQSRIDEEFDAAITQVHPFGLFVQAERWGFEGLLHVSKLGDSRYEYDAEKLCLAAKEGRRAFRVGERLRVRLEAVDPDLREIHFDLAETEGGGPPARPPPRREADGPGARRPAKAKKARRKGELRGKAAPGPKRKREKQAHRKR